MSRERLFRRDDIGVFDWQTRARELSVDGETARWCYEVSLHNARGDVQRAEALYLQQLRAIAQAQTAEPAPPVPGRLNRASYETSPGKYWTPEELAQLPAGKFTRVQIETTRQEKFPGYDEWLASTSSLSVDLKAASAAADGVARTPDEGAGRTPDEGAGRTPDAAEGERAQRNPAAGAPARLGSDQAAPAQEPRSPSSIAPTARGSPFARKPVPATASAVRRAAVPSAATPVVSPAAAAVVPSAAATPMVPSAATAVVPQGATAVVPQGATAVVPSADTAVVPQGATAGVASAATPVVLLATMPVVASAAAPVVPPATMPVVAFAAAPVVPQAAMPMVPQAATAVVASAATPVVPQAAMPVVPQAAMAVVASAATPVVPQAATAVVASAATPVALPATMPVVLPAATPVASPAAAPAVFAAGPAATILRQQLEAAAVAGRGVAEMLTAADPALARDVLLQLRADATPAFRLVTQAAAGEVTRVLGHNSEGPAMLADLPARRPPRDGQLPADVLARMERAYGQRFEDVEIHLGSTDVAGGQQAVTRGRHIYFESGAFDPDSQHGAQVIAHELAHVAQHARATSGGQPAPRAALEGEAHQAALAAIAGQAATVNLSAPANAALGFSEGKQPHAPAAASPPASGAHGASPASARSPAPAAARSSAPAAKSAAASRTSASARAPGALSTGAVPASSARKGAGGDGLLIPEAPTALTPSAAARLHTTQVGNQGVAAATTQLPTAEHQTGVARGAVVEPQAEQDAHAQHGVVTAVDTRPPPSPEIEQACVRIRQVIRDKRPPDEDKLVEAKPKEMAQAAGEQMSAGVEQRTGEVRQGYADIQQSPTGTPSTTPVPATLPPAKAQTPQVDAAAGTPDPLGHNDVSLDGDVAAQQKKIEDAGMNTEPGKLVKDGPIGDAREGASDLQSMAKTDPQKVLADQAAAITKAKGDMQALQAAGEKALADARAGTVAHIGKHTTGVKGSEEQQRAQAGEKMKGIFSRTQQSVDTLLQPLAGNASARWDAGVAKLSTEFEGSLAIVKKYVDDRHSFSLNPLHDLSTLGNLAHDKVFGLPQEVTDAYDRAEARFGDGATNLIRDISRDVNAVIDDCKKLIQQARKDIDDVVKSLPASLQTWAQGEAAKLGQQLDALDKRVDQTQQNINKDLINHANSAVQQVRERVAQLREEAKGFLAKIADAIGEFLKDPFKAIVNGLLRILGIPPASFWSLVDKLGDVVGAIAKDPVKFGKTLISGAAQGFKQFFEHFPTHLKEIVMGWLFGQLGTTGIPMPTDFSAAGIMPTVLGIVGIDTGSIMSMFGADVSDPAEMAEVHQELAGVLAGDPHALVALFRDHFDPASLIPMIKEAAMAFLIQALITQVAPRIAAMLVPGGAILQAIEAIFKVLMWVINNAARIFTLIESLVATAGQAVAGNTAGVAAGVESGLVQIIVLVIDFLASYIGLGGIGAKLKGVIMKVAGKLKGILKKVVDAIAKRAKAKAKAKHDQHKPADKKHDDDKAAAPHHPKQDERDPQKVKDDAKDPRNHMRDPDDKDPRNHHKDDDDRDPRNHHKKEDDNDPRNHHKHDDEHEPKKHKDHDDEHDPKKRKDEEDPKKKHEHDLAEAKRAARAAANRGWSAARSSTEREVQSSAELKRVLARTEHSTPKVKISLDVEDKATAWTVEATARIDGAHASDTEGQGWIARGDGNRPWYVARDLSSSNRKLVEEGFRKLERVPGSRGSDDAEDSDRESYERQVREGKQVAAEMQQRLDAQIRGLTAGIEMEPWSGVEKDRLIKTKLSIKPNSVEEVRDEALDVPLTSRRTAKWSGGEEVIDVDKSGGQTKISNASGASIANLLSDVLNTRFRNSHNTAGARAINTVHHRIRRLEQESSEGARSVAKAVVKIIQEFGSEFRIPNLQRLQVVMDAEKRTEDIGFNIPRWVKRPSHNRFVRELERQRDDQQKECNLLTVDEWLANLNVYKTNNRDWTADLTEDAAMAAMSELHNRFWDQDIIGQQKRQNAGSSQHAPASGTAATAQAKLNEFIYKMAGQNGLTPAEVLEELRAYTESRPSRRSGMVPRQVISDRYMGRYGDEDKFRDVHIEGIKALRNNPAWAGLMKSGRMEVILHNPDQIGGGHGSVLSKLAASEVPVPPGQPDHDPAKWNAYLDKLKKYVGPAAVNDVFGKFWKSRSRHIAAWLKERYPEVSYSLWRMQLELTVTYKGNTSVSGDGTSATDDPPAGGGSDSSSGGG